MNMRGVCSLFKIDTQLRESHYYPKFAIRYLKETSTGYLRRYSNINIGMQDGLKEYLLCPDAEQMFSKKETWFANNFFHPHIKGGRDQYSYDNNLYYFVISLLWRTLLLQLRDPAIQKDWYYSRLLDCEKEWRLFLLMGQMPVLYQDVFMLAIHPDSIKIPTLKGAQFYLLRDLDSTIVTSSPGIYMYAKLPRFIFWAPILSIHFSEVNWIDPLGGILKSRGIPDEPAIFGFLTNRITQLGHLSKGLSEKQQKIILNRIKQQSDQFLQTEAGRLILTGE